MPQQQPTNDVTISRSNSNHHLQHATRQLATRLQTMDTRKIPKASAVRDLSSVLAPKRPKLNLSDDELPPPYTATELPELHACVLPSYLSACPLRPYRALPHTIRGHHRLAQLNSITLSGPDKERLYYVELHRGYQRLDPLGYRVGVVLRNGTRSRDEVLAAAGEEFQSALKIYGIPTPPDPNTVFFMPPLEFGTNSRAMNMEKLRPGAMGPLQTFTFFIEVEPLQSLKRQKFEWVRDTDTSGFKLVRVLKNFSKSSDDGGDGSSSSSSSSSSAGTDLYGETVALLVFPHSSLTNREAFTLSFLGSARDGRLGERCQLAIVVTALRVWHFHAKGLLERLLV
jgi:hypothetical protein